MYKLLIVDDEQIEREGMAHFIQWDKYDIQLCGTAWNGADALGKIQKDVPDIVLTDIKMPVMNGIELIQKLSETYRNIVVVVLSGYGEYEFTSQAMEYGIRHYILKPCDEDKIVAVMNDAKKEVESLSLPASEASKRVSPFTIIWPLSGLSRKLRHRNSVVFPEPDEPIIARALPSSMEKLTSLSTLVLPKCFSIFLTSKIAMSSSYLK